MKKIVIGITFIWCLIVSYFVFFTKQKESLHYVSMPTLFNESNLNNKFKKSLENLKEQGNLKLRDYQNQINFSTALSDAQKQQMLSNEFVKYQASLQREIEEKSKKFEEIIWEDINKKITKYGKMHGIKIIFGAKGDGTIMYADEQINITKDLVSYINKK